MAHTLHAVLLLAIVVVGCYAAIPGHVSTFMIEPGGYGKETVKLVSDTASVMCTVEYDTASAEESAKKKEFTPAPQLVEEITKKYGCLKHEKDIFKYEICLGDEIKQTANTEHYSLGKYEKLVEGVSATQTYTKGTFCDVAHTDRKSVLEFTCAEEAEVNSIEEHAVCQYRIIIGVPEVCGHPQFSVVTGGKAEAWVVEIQETDEGSVICQAYNNGLDVIGSHVFSTFSLSLSSGSYSLTKYAVRNKNRKLADVDALKMRVAPAGIYLTKKQQLDYVKIVAQ